METSVNAKVKCLSGLSVKDLSEWEQEFVKSVVQRTRRGEDCSKISEKQMAIIDRIYSKHFAG